MSYQLPKFRHPELPRNDLGYTKADYEGAISTLCAGCGHDSISGAIVKACHELSIEPHKIAKLSGIGCSSKAPTYFLGNSHGFNSVHGRMPSVVTGAALANPSASTSMTWTCLVKSSTVRALPYRALPNVGSTWLGPAT